MCLHCTLTSMYFVWCSLLLIKTKEAFYLFFLMNSNNFLQWSVEKYMSMYLLQETTCKLTVAYSRKTVCLFYFCAIYKLYIYTNINVPGKEAQGSQLGLCKRLR